MRAQEQQIREHRLPSFGSGSTALAKPAPSKNKYRLARVNTSTTTKTTNNHSDRRGNSSDHNTTTREAARRVDHDVCTRYQSAMVDHAPTAGFAAAARSCLRHEDKMIEALAFQRVAINNCHAHVVEERPSDAPEGVDGRPRLRRKPSAAARGGGGRGRGRPVHAASLWCCSPSCPPSRAWWWWWSSSWWSAPPSWESSSWFS